MDDHGYALPLPHEWQVKFHGARTWPLYPQKRTWRAAISMPALCQSHRPARPTQRDALPAREFQIVEGLCISQENTRVPRFCNALAVLPFTNQEGGPMPFTETTRITLVAAQDVDLHAGIVMPPGSYPGTKTRTRVSYLDGSVNWTPTRYRIELTAEQLASMGATVQPNQSSEEIDVTEFVRLGLLKLA